MSIYIFTAVFSVLFGILGSQLPNKRNNFFYCVVMFFILFLISGFRANSVGTDTAGYLNIFHNINYSADWSEMFSYSVEPLFFLLNKIAFLFSKNSQSIVILSSFFINFFVIKRIYTSSENPWLSIYLFLTLYIYPQSLNGMRQYIAIAIIFYYSKYISEGKFIKFILGVIFATGFHMTAIFSIPFYFIRYIKFKNSTIIKLLIGSSLVVVFFEYIVEIVFVLFPSYTIYQESLFSGGGGIRDIALSLLILCMGLLMRPKKIGYSVYNELTMYMILYLVTSILMLSGSANIINRIGWYFQIFSILYIPMIINRVLDKKLKTIILYIIICFSFLLNIYLLSSNFHKIVPYEIFN